MFQKVDVNPGESIKQQYFCPDQLSDSDELNTAQKYKFASGYVIFFFKFGIL